MIVDFHNLKEIEANISDPKTNIVGLIFLIIGVVVLLFPLILNLIFDDVQAQSLSELYEYTKYVGIFFVVSGLFAIGAIRTGTRKHKPLDLE